MTNSTFVATRTEVLPPHVKALRAMEARDEAILKIAKLRLEVETLHNRHSDDLDFHTVSVWQLRAALNEAFQAGREAALDGMAGPTLSAR